MANRILGDVWELETPDEACEADRLSYICQKAYDGDRKAQNLLKKVWQGESWKSIKEKLEVEGSVWYVWYMDGVREFMRLERKK